MLSDITINHTVSGMVVSDGGGLVINIASGYARCEGWRIVTTGESHTMTSADDTYYIYAEITKTGEKLASVTITEYTSEQSTTNRIYLATVEVISGGTDIGTITDKRNFYAFTADKIQISGSIRLSDWRHTSDLTKLDGADIQPTSIPWATVSKTGSNITDLASHDHGDLTGLGDHDHTIYPRKASAETITGQWTFNANTSMGTEQAFDFYDGVGQVGRIIGYSNELRIVTYASTLVLRDQNRDYINIDIETDSENPSSGYIRPTNHGAGSVGLDARAFYRMRACSFTDVCSDINVPKNALTTLNSIMLQDIGAKIRDEPDKHVLKSEKLPAFLRGKSDKNPNKPGEARNLSATVSFLQGCIYELSQDNKKLKEKISTLELAIAMLQP